MNLREKCGTTGEMGRSSSEQGRRSTYGYNAISISSGDFCATFGRSKVVNRLLYGAELLWGVPQRNYGTRGNKTKVDAPSMNTLKLTILN